MTDWTGRPHHEAGPVALIIGCGDIGMASARALGRDNQLVIADLSERRLNAATEALKLEGFVARGHVCDITNAEQVAGLGESVSQSGVRTLVHVAAIGVGEWQQIMRVDLLAPHLIARAIGPHLVPGGAGIFIGSLASYTAPSAPELLQVLDNPLEANFFAELCAVYGKTPQWHQAYALSKLGMRRLVDRLAVSWGPIQARAISISPGMIDTTMARTDGGMLAKPGSDGELITRGELARITLPMGREGTIPEVAGVIAFMASNEASYISGVDIVLDGGALASNRVRGTMA